MKNVQIAVKNRGDAVRLAAAAAALATSGTDLDVVHVLEADSRRASAEAEGAVGEAVEELRALGFRARGHVDATCGADVAGRLAERARAWRAEAVVVGSRGLDQVGGLIGRSVSHGLVARLDLPILVLPDGARLPVSGYRRVLAAIGTEGDARAAVAAVRLLPQPVEVVAVHVPRRVALHAGAGVANSYLEIGETSTDVLDAALRGFREAGWRIATRSVDRDGGVGEAICDAARGSDADLIVLGPRRPSEVGALVAGSTAYAVLRNSDRPVLIAGLEVTR